MSSNGGSNTNERSVGPDSGSLRSNSNLSSVNGDGSDSGSTRFRHRKISVKQRLRIHLPSDLKNLDKNEIQKRELLDVETGVEKNEEKEVHLHRILQKASVLEHLNSKKDYIPTPDASKTWSDYDKFYSGKFVETQAYVKFSVTVEDCCGVPYTLDEIDDDFLENSLNKNSDLKLNEDEFESLCSAFETAIKERQPFLQMDPETILTFDEVKPTLLKVDFNNMHLRSQLAQEVAAIHNPQTANSSSDGNGPFTTVFDSSTTTNVRPIPELIEKYGKEVYEHWSRRKIEAKGAEIFPQLKFERPGEKEEVDPYVCFRRRELRHPRKTRRVDILNSQKLRILLKELRHAKDMSLLVAQREQINLQLIEDDLKILNKRKHVISIKRKLDIKGEDEDLINHKRKRPTIMTIEKKRQQEEALAAAKRAAEQEKAAAAAKAAEAKNKSKAQKKQNEQAAKVKSSKQKNSSSQDLTKKVTQAESQSEEQQPAMSHVYVKLPSSKIPDIVLEDVEKLLQNKEKSARRFVQERMARRKLEDNDEFINLTDDPHNPVFDLATLNCSEVPFSPFSSIASSKLKINKSFYLRDLNDYLNGIATDLKVFNKDGEKIEDNKTASGNQNVRKTEVYNPFDSGSELHSREYPVKFRRRFGRGNIEYLDVKRKIDNFSDTRFCEFIDFKAIENQELENNGRNLDVYESRADEFSRLLEKWKFDSTNNEYGLRFSDEPARLNQISNDTQVIRFGTMLGTKSYEQLKEATIRYRKDYISRIRQQKLNAQKQQQILQQQQFLQQQQENGSPNNATMPINPINKSTLKQDVASNVLVGTQQKS